jgi:hypothetical protein
MTYYYDHLKGTFVSDTDATDLGKDVPVRKPNAVPPKTKTIKKFNQGGSAASKPLVPDLEKLVDLYDNPQGESKKESTDLGHNESISKRKSKKGRLF